MRHKLTGVLQTALVTTKQKILQIEGPDIKEGMSDQIRDWFMQCREQVSGTMHSLAYVSWSHTSGC